MPRFHAMLCYMICYMAAMWLQDLVVFVVLSTQVMESTNRGMEVLWGTRLSDGQQCVVKTRQKAFQCLFDSRSV